VLAERRRYKSGLVAKGIYIEVQIDAP